MFSLMMASWYSWSNLGWIIYMHGRMSCWYRVVAEIHCGHGSFIIFDVIPKGAAIEQTK